MIEILLNKVLFVLFFLSILNVLKHGFEIIRRVIQQDIPEKYVLDKTQLVLLGLSISFIITSVFTGVEI